MNHNDDISANNDELAVDRSSMSSRQQFPMPEGGTGGANFPPDPVGTVCSTRTGQQPALTANSSNSSADISSNNSASPSVFSSAFQMTPTSTRCSSVFTFAPPPHEFPIQLKILHILMAHISAGETKEKVICRLQSPSAVAKGQLGFVVEHECGPFTRTGNVFAEQRLRDLERRSQASVAEFGSKFVELDPPPPMNTLTLLCLASDRLQMDPQVTIEVARKLNKIGLISSPLTNGDKYSPGFPRKEMVSAVILHLDELCGNRMNAQDVLLHFVRPTHPLASTEPICPLLVDHKDPKYKKALVDDKLACRLYELVCCYFLATCMRPSKIAEMTIKFSVGPEIFKSTKHTVVIDGFLLAAPWMRPEYNDTELPTEATKNQNQFIKQSFIVSDVRRVHIEKPKGGLSEAKLISQMALLGLGNYDTIPETLSKLVQKKLVNVIGPGRWIVPTSEGLQKLESFRREDAFGTDHEQTAAEDSCEEQSRNECEGNTGCMKSYRSDRTGRKRVRFDLRDHSRTERLRTQSMAPPTRQRDLDVDRSGLLPMRRHLRAPSPEPIRRSPPSHSYAEQPRNQWNLHQERENSQRLSRYSSASTFDASTRSDGGHTSKIFVCNLSARIDWNTLISVFRPFGSIRNALLFAERGFAFVEFSKLSEAERAISKMDGQSIDGGFPLRVRKSRPKRPWAAESSTNRHPAHSLNQSVHYNNDNGHRWQQKGRQSTTPLFATPQSAPNVRQRSDPRATYNSTSPPPFPCQQRSDSPATFTSPPPFPRQQRSDSPATYTSTPPFLRQQRSDLTTPPPFLRQQRSDPPATYNTSTPPFPHQQQLRHGSSSDVWSPRKKPRFVVDHSLQSSFGTPPANLFSSKQSPAGPFQQRPPFRPWRPQLAVLSSTPRHFPSAVSDDGHFFFQ